MGTTVSCTTNLAYMYEVLCNRMHVQLIVIVYVLVMSVNIEYIKVYDIVLIKETV